VRHFFRTQLTPVAILEIADVFFPALPLERSAHTSRTRTYSGALGNLQLSVKMEGGHYAFVEVHTDQIGESRLDRNTKRFFVELHRTAHPSHKLRAAY